MKTPMKTLGLIRTIGATVATTAAIVTLMFTATLGQAAGLPAIAWSPVTSPGTFDYGAVNVGQAASQTFALTNSGGSATGMLRVSLGTATEFSVTADACTGVALGPRKSCNVTVQYAPTTAGQTTATLAANGIRPAASASITLTGTGAAVAVRHIYWTNYFGTIGRADLDGSNPNQSFITGASGPYGLAVDAEHIYWTNANTNSRPGRPRRLEPEPELHHRRVRPLWRGGRRRAHLLGQLLLPLHDRPGRPRRLEPNQASSQPCYYPRAWRSTPSTSTGPTHLIGNSIGRADLDGSNPNQFFITGATSPFGVAVDAGHIYWTNSGSPTRSAGPTSTARTRTRASSPARTAPRAWRSTPSTSTGPTPAPTRSAGPTSTARTRTRASSPARSSPTAWRWTASLAVINLSRAGWQAIPPDLFLL